MQYRPLPTVTEQQPDETGPEYAARVLRFLISDRCAVTLTDLQLDLAWKASQVAITAAYDRSQAAQAVIAALYSARELITTTQRHRRHLDSLDAAQAPQDRATASQAPQGGTQPGRPAPLQPPTPQLPPAPAYAIPQPSARELLADRF